MQSRAACQAVDTAAALGAVYGGATVCAWYPITPSTSLAEAFTDYCGRLRHDPETGQARYAIVQAEDEIASIGMVVGAGPPAELAAYVRAEQALWKKIVIENRLVAD